MWIHDLHLSIKNNLKTWLGSHKIISDTIDLLDAIIVNLGIEFEIRTEQSVNKYQVLQKCFDILQREYSVKHLIGQPFEISRILKLFDFFPSKFSSLNN